MLKTRFTEMVGCSVPTQLAGMGWLSYPTAANAVAAAGGLGMVSVYSDYGGPSERVAAILDTLDEHPAGAVGANFIAQWGERSLLEEQVATAAARVDVVDFFYTEPDAALVEIVHGADALAAWQVGSCDEAMAAVDAGCDFIIAQGMGAGAHVRGRIGLLPLLDQVLAAVDVPVLAAGGIGSGRAMAAVLAAGADGVRVGTRFIACKEAAAHPRYVEALIAAEAQDTVLTEDFNSGAYPDEATRVLRPCLDAAHAFEGEIVGENMNLWTGERFPMHRFAPDAINKGATGNIAAMPMFAGESVGGVKRVQTAAEIIEEMAGEAERLVKRWH